MHHELGIAGVDERDAPMGSNSSGSRLDRNFSACYKHFRFFGAYVNQRPVSHFFLVG